MLIETIVLFAIVSMVISIMVILIVETLHTTKSISKKRNKSNLEKKEVNYTNIYR
nr:hypothetical protein [Sedimentibacter sp.]